MNWKIVNKSEIPEQGHNWAERPDIKNLLMNVPEDGKAICAEVTDKRRRLSDAALIRSKILRKKLDIQVFVRGDKIYLFREKK